MPGGVVHLQWYATGFRGDDLEAALQEIVPMSTRFGATRYLVFRQREDRYRFLMSIEWRDKADWDRFWFSPEFTEMRAACTGCIRSRCCTPGPTSSARGSCVSLLRWANGSSDGRRPDRVARRLPADGGVVDPL